MRAQSIHELWQREERNQKRLPLGTAVKAEDIYQRNGAYAVTIVVISLVLLKQIVCHGGSALLLITAPSDD